MGLQDRVKQPVKPSAPSLSARKQLRQRTLTNQEFEQLRMDLEDILQEFEPDNADTATALLKQYEGLEVELVECYRYYYTKDGRPLELIVDAVEDTALCQAAKTTMDNNQVGSGGHSLAQSFRKRLSLPKPAIATYLNAKLIAKFRKAQGKPTGSKMEGIRGPEVARKPPSPKVKPHQRFLMAQPTKAMATLINRVRGNSVGGSSTKDDALNPFEVKPRSRSDAGRRGSGIAAASASPMEVRCLDTGEALRADYVNQQVLEHKKELSKPGAKKTFRDKVIVFLQKYDIAAVDSVDELLAFGGKTNEEIWDDLQITYKVNQRSRLLQLFQKYDPDRVPTVDILLEDYAGHIEDMIAYYKGRYADQRRADLIRNDPCTWNPGQANTYQLLPGGQ
ncbi:hypothetical protein H310_12014 [Aphanomyces invadans]|uniref:Uncharacterized protein n=1 Tax=Aphanomyces invadans TaxID=157072 RepID=A0A024TL91_9STRA|nr:hypothetical protein H310_12014 [Aphanomyces invadans]ETV94376.1 hypothetical protein H310_12014 [Aphanomyces invadans]|eukprot:XP_008877138.1 hypothetical protein H310_12014 [Aphanomyces invadans]